MTEQPPRQRRVVIDPEAQRFSSRPIEAILQEAGFDLSQSYAILPDMQGRDVYVQTILTPLGAEDVVPDEEPTP